MVSENEKNKIKQFISKKQDPKWALRKAKLLAKYGLNDEFDNDLKVLLFCTKNSLENNYFILVDYFVSTYDLDPEIVETWILSIMHADQSFFESTFQTDHIRIKYADVDAGGSTEQDYTPKLDERVPASKFVEIRIGRSVHREDLLYFIDKNWDSMRNHIVTIEPGRKKRISDDPFKTAFIRNLRDTGMTFKKIRETLECHPVYMHDDFLSDSQLSKLVKKQKNGGDWLNQPKLIIDEMIRNNKVTKLDLIYESEPFKHFFLEY